MVIIVATFGAIVELGKIETCAELRQGDCMIDIAFRETQQPGTDASLPAILVLAMLLRVALQRHGWQSASWSPA